MIKGHWLASVIALKSHDTMSLRPLDGITPDYSKDEATSAALIKPQVSRVPHANRDIQDYTETVSDWL